MKSPAIGFGTSPYRAGEPPLDVEPAIRIAIAAGFRLFDVAEMYGNERAVGRALRDGPRDEIAVIGKVWRTNYRPKDLRSACEASLRRLGIERFDFYLLHAPGALRHIAPLEDAEDIGWAEQQRRASSTAADDVPLSETWAAMQSLVEDGLSARIGVSNFEVDDLDALSGCAATQIPCWPFDDSIIEAYRKRKITVFGYSPFQRRDQTLSWLIRHGVTPITFSTNPQHIRQNMAAVS